VRLGTDERAWCIADGGFSPSPRYHATELVRYDPGMDEKLRSALDRARKLDRQVAALERRVTRLEGEAAKAPPPPRGRSAPVK